MPEGAIRRIISAGDIDPTDPPNINIFGVTIATPGDSGAVAATVFDFTLAAGSRIIFLQNIGALPDGVVADYSVKLYRSDADRTGDTNVFFDSGSITSSAGSPTQFAETPSIFVDLGSANTTVFGRVDVVGAETPTMTMTSELARFTLT